MNIPKPAPKELVSIFHFIENNEIKLTNKYYNAFNGLYSTYISYTNDLFIKWFNKKEYSDEHLAEHIFTIETKGSNIKNVYKYQFKAIIITVVRTYRSIDHFYKKKDKINFKESIFKLKNIIFESIVFINIAHYYITGTYANWGYGRRTLAHSREIFNAALMLFNRKFIEHIVGSNIIMPTSVVLIRQAIDLRIKNAFGINTINNADGSIKRLPAERLIELVKRNQKDIEFPIKLSLLLKIHKWTQYYIHGGIIPDSWTIEWALYILDPLFRSGNVKNQWSKSGSIKIKKTVLDNLENDLKIILKDNNITLDKLSSPECIVI